MARTDRLVFDAEPLIAHADDEPGGRTVEERLDAVRVDAVAGYVNYVTLTEVRYVLARKYNREVVDAYLGWLFELGIEPVGVDGLWVDAADYVLEYNPSLGDSFALATAELLDAPLLVGGDGDYDGLDGVSIERFRDGSA